MLLLLTAIPACTTPAKREGVGIQRVALPEWARTGVHPSYPEADYLLAWGFASRRRDSLRQANDRLEQAISGLALKRHADQLSDTQFATVVTAPAVWFTLGEFDDAIRGDVAGNGFETVTLRAISYNELGLRARSMLTAAKKELDDSAEPPRGLGDIRKRCELWAAYFHKAVRVLCLQFMADGTLDRSAFAKAENAAVSLWEIPALLRANQTGMGQYARIRGGLPDPLVLSLTYRGQSVAGVPLLWGFSPGFHGELKGDPELNNAGIATCRVSTALPTGQPVGLVQAQLDIDRLYGRPLGIYMPVWLWSMTLPSRNQGEVVLSIKETFDGVENPGMLLDSFESWATARGLNHTRDQASTRTLSYRLKLEGSIEVVTTEKDPPSAKATGLFTLTDMETGQVLYQYGPGILKQGQKGNTRATIGQIAQREAAAEVLSEFAARLLATLPGTQDEFSTGR